MQPLFPVSDTTLKILKNFSGFSDQLLLTEGQTQKTIHDTAVFAVAQLPEAWPKETAIYNLSSFLGSLSLFEKPAIQFDADAMVITNNAKENKLRIKYRYSDPTTIKPIKAKELSFESPSLVFLLNASELASLKKTASMLHLTHFTLTVDTDRVVFTAADPKNPNSHVFELAIQPSAGTRNDPAFTRSIRFQAAHFNYLLDGDYSISLAAWKYAYLKHLSSPVTYFIAEDRT